MSVLPILRWPDPRLSKVCAPVNGDVRVLADDMLETLYDAAGRGLAAPQVGQMQRLFVMDVDWKEGARAPVIFVNPRIVSASETLVRGTEGCLSIPGVTAEVIRPDAVTVAWHDLDGAACEERFDGFAARCVQHEIDHLDGIVTFDRVDAAQRARLEASYDG